MHQLNDMAFYMLHFFNFKASVNIFNVNIKLKMPPTKQEKAGNQYFHLSLHYFQPFLNQNQHLCHI